MQVCTLQVLLVFLFIFQLYMYTLFDEQDLKYMKTIFLYLHIVLINFFTLKSLKYHFV